MGLRLRIIIAEAFIKHQWPSAHYFALEKGKKGRALLVQTMAEVPGGYSYNDAHLD